MLYEPALTASFYATYRAGWETFDPLRAADLAAWLPAGCALWRATGGPLSISGEESAMRWLDFRLRVLAWLQSEDGRHGRNVPKPPERVPFKWEAEAAASKNLRKWEARQRRAAN